MKDINNPSCQAKEINIIQYNKHKEESKQSRKE
jgi:hypothetical protein